MDFDHTLMKIEKFDEIAIPREKVGNLAYPMEGEIVISHSSYDRQVSTIVGSAYRGSAVIFDLLAIDSAQSNRCISLSNSTV